MNQAQIEIQLIALLVSVACAIPGVFLVLRKMAMISDAISHAILPGIVLGFFAVQNISSPLLVVLAALTGIVTVILVELINKTALVKEDTAIGLVFPALFSLGVILISRNAGDVHLDTDAVLTGELAFAPFERLHIGNMDIGPESLWVMAGILVITVVLVLTFYKEIKISTFDAGLAASLGFSPAVIHYSLMTVTSVTTVGAFNAVGAILVVALMIVPAATAYLFTRSLKRMLILSVLAGAFSAIAGYWTAHILDVSISGSIATVLGLLFLVSFVIAPGNGLISSMIRQHHQKLEYLQLTFLTHISNHSNTDPEENKIGHMTGHFNWEKEKAGRILKMALRNRFVELSDDSISLTKTGREYIGQS